MQQVQLINDRLREVLLREQQSRDSFWGENGTYLPKHLVPNLTSAVPNLSINPDPFDELLPTVEGGEEAEAKILIAADPTAKSEEVAEWKAKCEDAQARGAASEQEAAALAREVQLLRADVAMAAKKATASENALLDSRKAHAALGAEHEKEAAQLQEELLQLRKAVDDGQCVAVATEEEVRRLEEEKAQLLQEKSAATLEVEALQDRLQGHEETAERALQRDTKARVDLQAELEKERARVRLLLALTATLEQPSPTDALAGVVAGTVTEGLDDTVAALEVAATALAALPELESRVAALDTSAAEGMREAQAQMIDNEKLSQELALAGVRVAELKDSLEQSSARVAKLEEEKATAVSTRKSAETAARAAQKEGSDARERLKETQIALDASNAEVVVLRDELEAATKEVLAMKRALTETASSSDALAQLKSVVADQQAAMEEARAKHCEMARKLEVAEAKTKTVERRAAARVEEVQNELKQVMEERNDSLSVSMQVQADLSDLRSSGNTNRFIVDRITALIRTMPQPLKADLQISEMSDPAEVFSELLQRAANAARGGGDARPVVALTQFQAGDVSLFFKNPAGFYEAFNFESPNHFIAPESLECFEEQQCALARSRSLALSPFLSLSLSPFLSFSVSLPPGFLAQDHATWPPQGLSADGSPGGATCVF